MKKYEFTEETINLHGHVLHRIIAVMNFSDVKAGDIGGFIEKKENLAHDRNARVSGDAKISGNAKISGDARVSGDAWVSGNARVSGDAKISGDAWVSENARVFGDAKISGDAWVSGNAWVSGDAKISGDARINNTFDYITIGPIGSRDSITTFYKSSDNVEVSCGCFSGSIDDFEKAVTETHGDNEHGRAYKAAIRFVETVLKEE